jgi:hypothetical protein
VFAVADGDVGCCYCAVDEAHELEG